MGVNLKLLHSRPRSLGASRSPGRPFGPPRRPGAVAGGPMGMGCGDL